MKQQLLCTFTYIDKLHTSLAQIYKTYSIDGVKNMQCYHYTVAPNNVICVYNVDINEKRLKDTITINRKKQTNTLYSINALNSLIKFLNNGVLDKTFVVNWEDYSNSLLLSDNVNGYKIVDIKELSY
jgi:hypothetical protein